MRRGSTTARCRWLVLVLLVGCAFDDLPGCQPENRLLDVCVTPGPERIEIRCDDNLSCDEASRRCAPGRVTCAPGTDACPEARTCVAGWCVVVGSVTFPCSGDADCLAHLECADGACRWPAGCEHDGDCMIGTICEGGACVEGVHCIRDRDCPAGLECDLETYRCVTERCRGDSQCGGGTVCLPDGTCGFPPDGSCRDDDGCSGGRVCVRRMCQDCTEDAQCADARVCGRLSRCVDAGRMHAPCEADADCGSGFCDDDSFCTNGTPDPDECTVDVPCDDPDLVCNGGAVPGDPSRGLCTPIGTGDCSYDPWLGRDPVGCAETELCYPSGRLPEQAALVACAAAPESCVGLDGECGGRGLVRDGPCLEDAMCASNACLDVPVPVALVETDGFDCSGGTCRWLIGPIGSCRSAARTDIGGACVEDGECMERTFCDGAICRGIHTALAGERCRGREHRDLDERCAYGLVCMSDMFCHAIGDGGAGASCADRDDCDEGHGCAGGVCVARPGDGEPCAAQLPCQEDHQCVPGTHTCAPAGGLDVGDGCDEGSAPCGLGLFCGASMTCERAAFPGETCSAGLPCIGGYDCVGGACAPVGG